jgi:hypothetical protein
VDASDFKVEHEIYRDCENSSPVRLTPDFPKLREVFGSLFGIISLDDLSCSQFTVCGPKGVLVLGPVYIVR